MSPCHLIKLVVLVILLRGQFAAATSVVVVVTKDRIVMGSDSKITGKDPLVKFGHVPDKIVVMNNAIAVAAVGETAETVFAHGNAEFHFSAFDLLEGIKNSLPPNASVSVIEGVIVEKMKTALDGFTPEMFNGLVKAHQPFLEDHIIFIIVGYVHHVPVVHSLYFKFNWNLGQVADPIINSEYTAPKGPQKLYFGERTAISLLDVPYSDARKAALSRYPATLRTEFPDPTAATDTAADLIRLECEFDSELVGPPIRIVTLMRNGELVVTILPK